MATHSSILTWKVPWTEEPGWLQSRGHKKSDTTKQLSTHATIFHGDFLKILRYLHIIQPPLKEIQVINKYFSSQANFETDGNVWTKILPKCEETLLKLQFGTLRISWELYDIPGWFVVFQFPTNIRLWKRRWFCLICPGWSGFLRKLLERSEEA